MKAILSKIYNILSDCESIIFNAIYEIFSAIALLLFFPFKFLWKVLKPSESFNSNKKIKLKEQPIKLFLLYVKDITSKLASPLNGSSIEDSADLIDFKYTRWCIFIYLVMASTYWFYEIGIPNIESPKKDFEQLISHDALVKLTVVFGATMGLIALLHRSIVSDYQIKQQNKTDIISNFYKVSEHINSHAEKIIPISKTSLINSKSNFPYGIIGSLFTDARNGNYEISRSVTNDLEKISKELDFGNHTKTGTYISVFYEIDEEEGYASLLFSLLYPLVREQFNFGITTYRTIKLPETLDLVNSLANRIETEITHYLNNLRNTKITFVVGILDIIEEHIKLVESIENLILTIPLNEDLTRDFFKASVKSKDNANGLLDRIQDFRNHIDEINSQDEKKYKNSGSGLKNMDLAKSVNSSLYQNNKIDLVFLYCCIKLDLKPNVAEKFELEQFIIFIDSLHSLPIGYSEIIKSYLGTLHHEDANSF